MSSDLDIALFDAATNCARDGAVATATDVDQELKRSECEICEDGCYRESLHRVSPLAVLIDRMEWPKTHGRISLRAEVQGKGWVAGIESRKDNVGFRADTRSAALRAAVSVCLEEEAPSDDLESDPLAALFDALPRWPPWNRIVLRRDQLHIYVYVGSKHYGGHGLAEALYNMIRLTKE